MYRTIIALIAALLLVSTASASFAVYIDDDGPPTDVILATDLVLRASTYTDEIPRSGYTALFSEYEEPADMMLVISNGDVWIVETSSSARLRTALVRAVSELDVDAEYTTKVPEVLGEWESNPDTNDDTSEAEDPESEANETESRNDTAPSVDSDEQAGDENGSNASEDGADETADEDVETRGFWGRIAYALFGWMRR